MLSIDDLFTLRIVDPCQDDKVKNMGGEEIFHRTHQYSLVPYSSFFDGRTLDILERRLHDQDSRRQDKIIEYVW